MISQTIDYQDIDQMAKYTGMEADAIYQFIYDIQDALENDDKAALAGMMKLPISQCGRSQGDTINDVGEFVENYERLVENIREEYIAWDLSAPFINYMGVCAKGICFSSICEDSKCENTTIKIIRLDHYCVYRSDAVYSIDELPTPGVVVVDETNFNYGEYRVIKYEGTLSYFINPDDYLGEYIGIDLNSPYESNFFWRSCEEIGFEFNPPFDGRESALWRGIPVIGELIILCDEQPITRFDILDEFQLGLYYDGYYFYLLHESVDYPH